MKRVVFDIETDGLLPDLTKIHCLVLRDVDTNEVMSCSDAAFEHGYTHYYSIETGLVALSMADAVYGHNSLGFDILAIQKVYPTFRLNAAHKDTFVIAGMRWAHIKAEDKKRPGFPKQFAGRHSLEAWGHRLKKHKGEYKQWCKDNGITEPFAIWRPEMQTYCEGDTDVTRDLVLAIRKGGVSPESVETEQGLREYLVGVENNGVPFDMDKAIAFQGRLAQRREDLAELLRKEFGSWQVRLKDFIPARNNKKLGYKKGVPVPKWKTVEFNPTSRDHIANRLTTLYGWKPDRHTEGGKPQVDEAALAGLTYPPIPLLQEYLLVDKRLGQLAESKKEGAWMQIARINPDTGLPHIHGRIHQNGTITARASHSSPNMSAVPKVGKPYGEECRELFMVPAGWDLVGADASSLEGRCLAHRMFRYDGGAFVKTVTEGTNALGTDIHSVNMRALGLPPGKESRDRAKTWFYAFLYGAGPAKLGRILMPDAPDKQHYKIGLEMQEAFFQNTPALKYLVDAVKAKVKDPGYLIGLDGRRIYIRSEHSALNSLLQGDGAIICKRWGYTFSRALTARFGPQGWRGQWAGLLWSHDEYQTATRPEITDEVCTILVSTIESLTEHFKFRCPLTGEAKVGRNWKETH